MGRPPHLGKPKSDGGTKRNNANRREGGGTWSLASPVDKQAANIISRLLASRDSRSGGVSIKTLALAPHIVAKKATFAVTSETLRFLPLLKEIIAEVKLLKEVPKLQQEGAYVLVYELLIGQGCKPHGGAERAVLARKAALKAALARRLAKARAKNPAELLSEAPKGAPRPRSARVNTLRGTVKEALKLLAQPPPSWGSCKAHKGIKAHEILPDVLLFPEGTDLHDHPMVLDGRLVLQSIASCMPAHALSPKPGWHCVDCCAAPGNKTTHVAARMQGKGSVMAFDRDKVRLKRLVANAKLTGASIISAEAKDFMTLDPSSDQFATVRGVILDPSCSGSGLTQTRGDALLKAAASAGRSKAEEEEAQKSDKERVEALAQFQESALLHALKFPALERLVYSTCSVHSRENEEVVAAVLPEAHKLGFDLADPFPKWHRRGLPLVEGAENLVRTDPLEDGTDGFFVAVFQRQSGPSKGANQADGGSQAPTAGNTGEADDKDTDGADCLDGTAGDNAEKLERQRLKRKRKKAKQKERKRAQKAEAAEDE